MPIKIEDKPHRDLLVIPSIVKMHTDSSHQLKKQYKNDFINEDQQHPV